MAYDQPHIVPSFRYDGCDIAWTDVAQKDRQKFRETIEAYAEALDERYDVETDLDGGDYGMKLRFDHPSSSIERQLMKGEVFAMIGDTIWGGGSG